MPKSVYTNLDTISNVDEKNALSVNYSAHCVQYDTSCKDSNQSNTSSSIITTRDNRAL